MATTYFAQGQSVGVYVLELGTTAGVDAQIALLEAWIVANPNVFYAYLVPAAWDFSKDEVGSVILSAGGSGYTSAPTVTFAAPGTGVTARACWTSSKATSPTSLALPPSPGRRVMPTSMITAPSFTQ